MAKPARYTIRSLEDISMIPTEKLDAFLGDLRSALLLGRSSANLADASAKHVHPNLQVGCTLTEMDWIDDGLCALNPEFEGKPAATIPGAQVPKVLHGFDALAGHLRNHPTQPHTR